jgi:glutathione synthase/RimK-type ligase-like ATP-grasp enzyme
MSSLKAALIKSDYRFSTFKEKMAEYDIDCTVLDFEDLEWVSYDYSHTDLLIYYPVFKFSSNHPLALYDVHDNIAFIHQNYPHLQIYPDPTIIRYYNDKYRQYLYLKSHNFPIPKTIPLFSKNCVEIAHQKLGYPLVIKNRYGAGGGAVFQVFSKKELMDYYKLSQLNLFNLGSVKYYAKMFTERLFYYQLIKVKKARYPFFSPPILAQEFIKIDRDLKTVVGNYKVVESHWRHQVNKDMWKMNIDGGATGVWSEVPHTAIELSIKLAKALNASWVNIDLIMRDGQFLITEFSPVWHHYAYKEKPSFVYRDSYNIDVPLDVSLNLESIIVESLIEAANEEKRQGERY